MPETRPPAGIVTCTLTLKDDHLGEYDDDLQYQRDEGKAQPGNLGRSQITRLVVELLDRWVDNYYKNCRRDELVILGKALYAIAFGDEAGHPDFPLRTAFESTLRQCRTRGMRLRLRLVLGPDVKDLADYPWEFMYLDLPEHEGFFLAGQNTSLSLTRFVPNSSDWRDRDGFDAEKLRILVVVSTPPIPDMTELSVGNFVDRLAAMDGERFDIRTVRSPTPDELRQEISGHQPHVVHFIGHGRPGGLALRKDEAILRQEQEDYDARRELGERPQPPSPAVWINEKTASDVLRAGLDDDRAPSRLIFLHACEGARADQTRDNLEGFTSVARELARSDRVSGVIAMQYTIGVEDAELFATAFYESIADGEALDDAMTKARKKLGETTRPDRDQTWDDRGFGTPVIYLRSERALVSPPARRRSPQAVAEKEPCPNGNCKAYVLRGQQPPRCKVCREPFSVCPACATGLVVPKPGWECRDCPYVFPDPSSEVSHPEPGRMDEGSACAPDGVPRQVRGPPRPSKQRGSAAGGGDELDDRRGSDFDPARGHPGAPPSSLHADHEDPGPTVDRPAPDEADGADEAWVDEADGPMGPTARRVRCSGHDDRVSTSRGPGAGPGPARAAGRSSCTPPRRGRTRRCATWSTSWSRSASRPSSSTTPTCWAAASTPRSPAASARPTSRR